MGSAGGGYERQHRGYNRGRCARERGAKVCEEGEVRGNAGYV